MEYRFKEKINLKSAHLHDIVTSEGSVKYPQHTEVSIPVYLRQPQVCVWGAWERSTVGDFYCKLTARQDRMDGCLDVSID